MSYHSRTATLTVKLVRVSPAKDGTAELAQSIERLLQNWSTVWDDWTISVQSSHVRYNWSEEDLGKAAKAAVSLTDSGGSRFRVVSQQL